MRSKIGHAQKTKVCSQKYGSEEDRVRKGITRHGNIVQSFNVKETSRGGGKPGINGNTPQVYLYDVMMKV